MFIDLDYNVLIPEQSPTLRYEDHGDQVPREKVRFVVLTVAHLFAFCLATESTADVVL